ncbi:unnamed protein product [Boreogadus saida]
MSTVGLAEAGTKMAAPLSADQQVRGQGNSNAWKHVRMETVRPDVRKINPNTQHMATVLFTDSGKEIGFDLEQEQTCKSCRKI